MKSGCWLLGGTLYFAYPQLYASAFSGFYLPLMMVLWLLMLRGIGIELRVQRREPGMAGILRCSVLCFQCAAGDLFGAALGNVIRGGVPLGADGYFFEPLWTNFQLGPHPGILDWYTRDGRRRGARDPHRAWSPYVRVKTDGELAGRCRALALERVACSVVADSGQPDRDVVRASFDQGKLSSRYPAGFLIPLVVFGSLVVMLLATRTGKEKQAFVASSIYITGMLVGAVFALYPVVLPASTDPALNLTIYNLGRRCPRTVWSSWPGGFRG